MWGKNSSGQLGLGKKAARVVRVPTKVEALHGITIQSVALGSEHSVAVTGLDPRFLSGYRRKHLFVF
jgi:alpha-tubulin suppressor-like RCC1 family protein